LFGADPSPRIGRSLMFRAISYRIQERAVGSLKPATRRFLDRIVEGRSELAPARIPKECANAGTVLIRQWRGVSHRVTVLDNDVVYRKRRYKSLSEVARAITGARWSRLCSSASSAGPRRQPMANTPIRRSIYTRKSSEEGLEQDFSSLHAQREACEAFIRNQAGEGWKLIKTAYDDGGLSGGTTERPALQRLLTDIRDGLIDVVVVYKVDRLTRSLADFAKMVELFDAHSVSFVAVTQQFNTTTSMGRLTLNVLPSFAQFEREVIGERIRDKVAASKRKGIWMGGTLPMGYDLCQRKLVINDEEARTVRQIFERYLELGSVRLLKKDLCGRGIVSGIKASKNGNRRGGKPFSRGALQPGAYVEKGTGDLFRISKEAWPRELPRSS
jgi:DNA invertase Pin-like site-specific DNA recombinase